MSRRRSDRNLTTIDTDTEVAWEFFESSGIPWWYATEMPGPWDGYYWHQWQHAWADYTMAVAESAWRNTGAKLYATHRDVDLRDDLKSWLMVRAVEAGARFTPDPWHPAPEKNYAAWLYGHLCVKARHHFADVVGWMGTPSGAARVDLRHNMGPSFEAQVEAHGGHLAHGALVSAPFETADPASVIIRLEDLNEQVAQIEREDRRQQLFTFGHGTYSTETTTCIVNLCTEPVAARSMCKNHYYLERTRSIQRGDWQPHTPEPCTVNDCGGEHYSRGMCRLHYREARRAEEIKERPQCAQADCTAPPYKQGTHCYHHRGSPTCDLPGCEEKSRAKGLCNKHYQQHKKGRLQR